MMRREDRATITAIIGVSSAGGEEKCGYQHRKTPRLKGAELYNFCMQKIMIKTQLLLVLSFSILTAKMHTT